MEEAMEETKVETTTEEVKTEEVKNPEAVLAELRRAQDDLKALREQVKTLTSEKETLESTNSNLQEQISNDVWKQRAIASEVKNALQAQGLQDTDRLMKFVNLDGLDFDESGKVVGLNERLSDLKNDLPEVFDPRRVVGSKADIFANNVAETASPFEQQVKRALGHSA